jgi:hypothetical protein
VFVVFVGEAGVGRFLAIVLEEDGRWILLTSVDDGMFGCSVCRRFEVYC